MGLSYTSIDSTYRCTVCDCHVSYAPAKEEEAPSQVETLGGSKQSSNCHTLAETHDDARVLVFVQLLDNSVEDFILRVAKYRVFLRDADVGLFCQLSESLYPALTVVFCNDKTKTFPGDFFQKLAVCFTSLETNYSLPHLYALDPT